MAIIPKDKVLKIGIIGCGGIANGKHMPALYNLKDVEMVAFCDIIVERAEKAAKDYGVETAKVYEDYKELLKDETIDIVHVLTPNRSHSVITVDALEAGKHVMCEKPMAINTAEAQKMLDAAKRTGKKLTIGYQNRQMPASQYLYKACRRGDLGDMYYARAHAIRRRAVPTWGVFLNEYEQGGGPLIDIGTHALDLTLWCMDNYKPKSVRGTVYKKLSQQTETGNAFGEWDPKEFTVEDSAFGFITMENGATIYLESAWALNTLDIDEAKTSISGTKAGADMKGPHGALRINTTDFGKLVTINPEMGAGGVAFYSGAGAAPQDIEARQWIDAIRNDTDPCVLPEQAIVVTQILEAIYESAALGKEVTF